MEIEKKPGIHPPPPPKSRKRTVACCLGTTVVIVAAIVVLAVILAFTVFKPKRPVTDIKSVSLKNLKVAVDILNLKVHLNLTLDVDVSVTNPNKVGFQHSDADAYLLYKNEVIGQAPIPAGKIRADSTTLVNLTLTVLADKLLSNSGVFSAVTGGSLPLTTSTTIPGKVSILHLFKLRVVSRSRCDLNINIANRTVDRSDCKYDTKL